MPLTADEIQDLEYIAYMCDGEPMEVFTRNVLPGVARADAGWILALAGMFAGRHMFEYARFLAQYGRMVWMADDDKRPDVSAAYRAWLAEREDDAKPLPELDELPPFWDTLNEDERILYRVLATAKVNQEGLDALKQDMIAGRTR
jgi:hypothetical protein